MLTKVTGYTVSTYPTSVYYMYTHTAMHTICCLSKDTIVDFDDMSNSIPGRSLGANVAKMKLITLHQSHIYRGERERRYSTA